MTTRPFYPASAPELPEEFWQELSEENPLGSDRITVTLTKDWFYLKAWPMFKTYPYGRTRSPMHLQNAIARWWARIDVAELREARHIRAVKEGRAKPLEHRPRRGSVEMPYEPRTVGEEQKMSRLRLVGGGA